MSRNFGWTLRIIIIIITHLYSAFKSEDTEALEAAHRRTK